MQKGTSKQEELTKQLVSVAEQKYCTYRRKQSALQALNLPHKSLAQKAQLTYYNMLKKSKQKALEFCDCPGCVAAKNIIDLKAEIK